jgi:hypothetical protein
MICHEFGEIPGETAGFCAVTLAGTELFVACQSWPVMTDDASTQRWVKQVSM